MGTWPDGTAGLVILPDGRRVRGRGLRTEAPSGGEPPEFGLYLSRKPYVVEQWRSVWVAWPDFGLPKDPGSAIAELRRGYALAAEHRVEVACRGGDGRTGTAIAILARLAGVPASHADAWTRAHYRPTAVETPWQRRFVRTVNLEADTLTRRR